MGTYIRSRETNDFCAGDYIDKTHAHAHITEHQYYYYSLKH